MPQTPERIDAPLTRRAWRRRCLRRDATVLILWTGLLIAAWASLRTHVAVTVLRHMTISNAGLRGGGWGSQVIFLSDGRLSESPGSVVVQGANVNWKCSG